MGVVDFFIDLLHEIWDRIKHFAVTVLNFAKNIVSFFKNPSRLKKLEEDKNRMAIAIKENLDNGDYKIVNCLYNKATNEVEDCKMAEGIEADDIDSETEQAFGDKTMIVLK